MMEPRYLFTSDLEETAVDPALDYSALSRLLATLVEQQNNAVVSITIRPQRPNTLEVPMLLHPAWLESAASHGQQNLWESNYTDPFPDLARV